MNRQITQKLLSWKDQPHRKPLLLRGARQVGKTWSVLDFGKNHFDGSVHLVDLEKHPDWHGVFDQNYDASRILSELELLLDRSIKPGPDLLFFDEIQSCPRAISALRYFFEEIPDLHVIAAGSLLEFAMRDVSVPVGRIQTLNMHPMSFAEFLQATGRTKLAEVPGASPRKLSDPVHEQLLETLRVYLFVGGMPEAVQRFGETGRIRDAFEVQSQLLNAFRQDFSKYAPSADKQCLNTVLASVARGVGRQIKYSKLSEGFSNPTLKKAVYLLSQARLFHKVRSVKTPVIPFGASVSDSRFKAVFLDVGLMQRLCGLPIDVEYQKQDLLSIYEGALAEQFVGQELLAAGEEELFYWAREAKSSSAEVDYLLARGGRVIPVEVKSGPSGKLRSMHQLLKSSHGDTTGVVLSCAPFSALPDQRLEFHPLYYAASLGADRAGQ
jgi:uncharacterized protein